MDTPQPSETRPSMRVHLDPCVEFIVRQIGGETLCVAKQSQTGKFFEFGHDEHAVMRLLRDGCELSQLESQLVDLGVSWTSHDIAAFVAMLAKERLVIVDESAAPPQPKPIASSRFGWKHVLSLMSFSISQRFPLLHADAITTRVNDYSGWFFGRYGLIVWCLLVISGGAISVSHHAELMGELRRLFDPGLWPVLAILWCALKVIHEFGHAVAAKRQGVRVGNMGVMFFLFAPLAYVDVTDAWRLKGRWARARIAMAGVYVELAIASIALWGYYYLSDGILRHLCAQTFVVAGPATLLVNANPLLRLDGYYVVSDLTDIANLRLHGRRQLVQLIERILFSIPRTHRMLSGWRRPAATFHAFASVLFQVVWMSGLVFAISTWAKGVGLMLAVIAVMLWCVLPLVRWIWKIWSMTPSIGQRRRLVTYMLLLATLGEYLAAAPSPFGRRVPVVVRYNGEQVARASADAFVQTVHAKHGQWIQTGAIVVVLDEPELRARRDAKADEVEAAELRVVQLRRQGEVASAASESQRAESLRRQLEEMSEQVNGLTITASRDGILLCPKMDELLGQFVHRGDEILRVGDPQQMELLISVSENDAGAFEKACESGRKISVRLRGGVWIMAQPEPLLPRARTSLPHPALASSAGGPLAVEPSPKERDQMQTIQPRLECITRLDPIASVEVRSGQIGSMSLADTRPLLTRIIESLTVDGGF